MQHIYIDEIPIDAPAIDAYNSDLPPPDSKNYNPNPAKTHTTPPQSESKFSAVATAAEISSFGASSVPKPVPTPPAALGVGDTVMIVGLLKAPAYNGKLAKLLAKNENEGRWTVQMVESLKKFKLKAQNLKLHQAAPPPGARAGQASWAKSSASGPATRQTSLEKTTNTINAMDITSKPTSSTPTLENQAQTLKRMHILLSINVIPKKEKKLLGLIFDYLDKDWRQALHKCKSQYRRVTGDRALEWGAFVRKTHKLSNKGLKQVYHTLAKHRSKFPETSLEGFNRMQTMMTDCMEDMVHNLTKQTTPNLQKVWALYASNSKDSYASNSKDSYGSNSKDSYGSYPKDSYGSTSKDGSKAANMEQNPHPVEDRDGQCGWILGSTFHRMFQDNLLVELQDIDQNQTFILDQAMINAVKPIDVLGSSTTSKDYHLIEKQKNAAKMRVLNSHTQILKQHKDEIVTKLKDSETYAHNLIKDMNFYLERQSKKGSLPVTTPATTAATKAATPTKPRKATALLKATKGTGDTSGSVDSPGQMTLATMRVSRNLFLTSYLLARAGLHKEREALQQHKYQ